MGQQLLTLRVRPPRLAVLIDVAASGDFVLAVKFLSQVWGGRYNPIIPVDRNQSDRLTEFQLHELRPDFVFGLNLDETVWKSAVHQACQPRQYVTLRPETIEDVRSDQFLELIHSDRAVIAKFVARSKPSAIIRPLVAASIEPDSPWAPYAAALFGIHHPKLNEKYRDEQVVLSIQNAADLVRIHCEFVENWKESWLDAGSFGLSLHNTMMQPPFEPTIVLVKDSIADLCYFWNLRLGCDTHIPVWVLPIPEDQARTPEVQSSLKDWLIAFSKYGEQTNYCQMTSASVPKEDVKQTAIALQEALKDSAIQYIDYKPPQKRIRGGVAYEYTTIWPADIQRRCLTVIPPSPKMFSCSSREAWFVDIVKDTKTGRAVKEMQLPENAIIPELLNGPCPPSFEQSSILRFGDGPDSINFRCTSSKETVRFHIPSPTEILEEILRDCGYKIISDEKRSSYIPTIRLFGGLHMAAAAFSGQSGQVLEILRSGRLNSIPDSPADIEHQSLLNAQGHVFLPEKIKGIGKFGNGRLTDDHYHERIKKLLHGESDRIKRIGTKRYRDFARRQVPTEMTLNAVLEHWADKSVLKRQWRIGPCTRCSRDSFVGQLNLQKPVRCGYCGNRVVMKGPVQIGYTLNRSIRHSLNEGLAPVVMAGRFVRNMSDRGFFWLPGLKYKKKDVGGDIDFLACCDGHLVFGECKRLTNTPPESSTWIATTEQFLKLAEVAIECKGAIVILAAQVDQVPPQVQDRIQRELSGRIPYLLLNNSDLQKGYRAGAGEGGFPWLRLSDLIPDQFPEDVIERSPGLRQINYGWGTFTRDC